MKAITILLLASLPYFIHAQSARKINENLRSEYQKTQKEYDSTFAAYQNKLLTLGGITIKTVALFEEKLTQKVKYLGKIKSEVLKCSSDLIKVDLLKSTFPDFNYERIDTIEPNYNEMAEKFKSVEPRVSPAFKAEEKNFAFDSDNLSLKAQNKHLEELLPEMHHEINLLTKTIKNIETMKAEYKKVNDLVEGWIVEIDGMIAFVKAYGAPVLAKREEIKLAVRANPKAFSEEYQNVFCEAVRQEAERIRK